MAFADENNGLILHAAIGAQQTNIPYPVDTKPTAGPVIILLLVDDDAQVVRLKLDGIQLGIELFDTAPGLYAIVLLPQTPDFCLDSSGIGLSVCDTIQLIQPTEYLAVSQRDNLIIPTGLRYGQRQLPLCLAQSAAVQLIYVFLTN